MKIASQPMVAQSMAALTREGAKPAAQRGERAQALTQTTETPAPARPDAGPPGLQRVLARLESMGESGRTAGQTQALDRIGRNLARYLENQALAPLPAPLPTPQPQPAPDTVAELPDDEAVPVAPDTGETGEVGEPTPPLLGDADAQEGDAPPEESSLV